MLLVVLNAFDVYKRIGRCMNWDVFMFDESSEEGTRSEIAGKDEFRIRRDALVIFFILLGKLKFWNSQMERLENTGKWRIRVQFQIRKQFFSKKWENKLFLTVNIVTGHKTTIYHSFFVFCFSSNRISASLVTP
jgi:hypothetical protein